MAERLVLDYNAMLSPRLGERGIGPARLDAAADEFRRVHAEVQRGRAAGRFGFYELPADRDTVQQVFAFADSARGRFDALVVLGIGGSALGTVALRGALLHPFWNELDDADRGGFPRLFVLDNVDPFTIEPLLERLDARRTLVNVVSKSGTTAETMAQFLILREWLRDALGDDYRDNLVFTTDPEQGVLRRLAAEENIACLPIPPAVGGRFSVLSPVGLLPGALVGIDIEACLAGAALMERRCAMDTLESNPAGLFAVLQYLAHVDMGAPIHVMMAYSDRLYGMTDWFRQLWAESLGKRLDLRGEAVFRGPTPVKALGATDQHSQVQLYMEGPFDKTITFLAARDGAPRLEIPRGYTGADELEYLGGQSLRALLDAERAATAAALTSAGRMNMTITVPAVDADALGQLFMLLQIATVYAGALYEVDPLDQPGVELGKTLTYGLMGRPGFEPPALAEPESRWVCA